MPRHLKLNSHNLLINISIQPRDCSLNALLANAARISAYSVSRRVHAPSLKHERDRRTPRHLQSLCCVAAGERGVQNQGILSTIRVLRWLTKQNSGSLTGRDIRVGTRNGGF